MKESLKISRGSGGGGKSSRVRKGTSDPQSRRERRLLCGPFLFWAKTILKEWDSFFPFGDKSINLRCVGLSPTCAVRGQNGFDYAQSINLKKMAAFVKEFADSSSYWASIKVIRV